MLTNQTESQYARVCPSALSVQVYSLSALRDIVHDARFAPPELPPLPHTLHNCSAALMTVASPLSTKAANKASKELKKGVERYLIDVKKCTVLESLLLLHFSLVYIAFTHKSYKQLMPPFKTC
jgi:hypothetical protein